jgi:hypothetical protein
MNKSFTNLFLIGINILFFTYYSLQLLIFTDEFAIKNIGFFNHAIAGLSEIIGIIFFSFAVGLTIIFFKGLKNQLPLFVIIFLNQIIISLNFWRYVLTGNVGETDSNTIMQNALIFSFSGFIMFILIIRNRKKL